MTSALERLLGLREAEDGFDISGSELQPLQLEAVRARFASRVDRIPLRKNRAEMFALQRFVHWMSDDDIET
jgi:hypothetical protein